MKCSMGFLKVDNKSLPPKSFCILPWVQIFSGQDATCKICCHSIGSKEFFNNENELFFLYKHNIEDIWNCKTLKELRIKMLKDEIVQECDACYLMEEKGGFSYRLYYFSYFYDEYLRLKESGEFEETLINSGKTKFNPLYLNFALSNRCNLSCRMCSPLASSLKAEETFKYMNTISNVPWQKFYLEFQEKYNFLDNAKFWGQIEKCIPHLKLIAISGGEPFLATKRVDTLVNQIISQKREDQIHLNIVTNLTLINYEYFKKLSDINWRCLQVTFSIDGVGSLQEYIRYPIKWKIFDNNIRILLECSKKIDLSVSITVQAYNVFHLTDIFDYIESFLKSINIRINFSFLSGPAYLKTDILPEDIKKQAIIKLYNFMERSKIVNNKDQNDFQFKNNLDVIIEDLKYEEDNLFVRRQEFINYTKTLDKLRGQNILDVCPEMKALFS